MADSPSVTPTTTTKVKINEEEEKKQLPPFDDSGEVDDLTAEQLEVQSLFINYIIDISTFAI